MALLVAPSASLAAPRALSVSFESAPVVGRTVNLDVRAADRDAPITGMVVAFGRGEGIFGLSACRLGGPGARTRSFAPGSSARLSAPHAFASTGPRPLLLRIDSGDCEHTSSSLLQPATVTPTRRGETPTGITLGTPSSPPPGSQPTPLPDLPELPGLPVGAQPPSLPIGTGAVASRVLKLLRACPGSERPIGRSPRSHRAARHRLLCLLNLVRRAYRLRLLRDNGRLTRAAAEHSRSMVRERFFAHTEPGGIGLRQRLMSVRYIPRRRPWEAGENIGFGDGLAGTPLAITIAWLNSASHWANMVRPSFREIGLGVASGIPAAPRRGATITTDFGYRR